MKYSLLNRYLLVLLLAFFNGKTNADSKLVKVTLEENTGAVLLLNHFSQDLYISPTQRPDERINFISFSDNYLSPKLLSLSPSPYTREISISLEAQPFGNERAAIEVKRLNLNAKEFHDLKKHLKYFTELKGKQGEVTSATINHLEEKLRLNKQFDNYLKTIIFDKHIQASEWLEAWQQLKLLNNSASLSIARQCMLLDKFLSSSPSSFRQDLHLEAIGKLAFDLYVYWAHHGKLSDNNEAELNINSYRSLCRTAVKKIAAEMNVLLKSTQKSSDEKRGFKKSNQNSSPKHNINPSNDTQSGWSIRSDANILFEYLLPRVPSNNKKLASELLKSLWLYFNFNDMHEMAEKSARDGIRAWYGVKNNKNFTLLAELYNNIFISLLRQGAFAEALKFTSKGINLVGRIQKPSEWRMYFNMALLHTYTGEYEMAKRYYQRALSTHAKNSQTTDSSSCQTPSTNKHQIGYSITMIGAMENELENHNKAQKLLECGEKILKASHSNHQYVAQIELAKLAIVNSAFEQAIQYSNLILDSDSSLTPQRLDALILKGTAILESKHGRSSREYFETTKEKLAFLFKYLDLDTLPQNFGGSTEYPIRQIQAFRMFMNYYNSIGQQKKSLSYAKAAIKLSRKYSLGLHNPQAWNSARFQFIKSYVGILMGNRTENVKELFSILELNYSLMPTLEKNIYSIANDTSVPKKSVYQAYKKWLEAERKLSVISSENEENAQYIADSAKDDFLSRQTVKKPTFAVLNRSLSLPSVQRNMPEQDILLRYFADSENTYAFILTKQHAEVRFIGHSKRLTKEIDSVLNNIGGGTGKTTTFNISQRLLPIDLIKNAQFKKLIIIPDGLLHRFPFSVLAISSNEKQDGRVLDYMQVVLTTSASTYYAVSNIPSEPISIALFSDPIASTRTSLLSHKTEVRRATGKNNFSALPGTNIEAQKIIEMFDTVDLKIGIQHGATNQFLMSEKARSSSIMHIATHGYYDPLTPELVGLITSGRNAQNINGNGFLGLSELLSKPVSSSLVVISGCDTHQGKYYNGSGLRSMTRGFLTQGAGSVIGTLWPVEDRATANFMIMFYRNLKKHKNSSKALQKTKQYMANTIRYRYPKYWAGFILTVSNRHYETINLN